MGLRLRINAVLAFLIVRQLPNQANRPAAPPASGAFQFGGGQGDCCVRPPPHRLEGRRDARQSVERG